MKKPADTVSPDDFAAALAWVRHRLDCDIGATDLQARGERGKSPALIIVARTLAARELREAGYSLQAIADAIGGSFRRQNVGLALDALPPRCPK